MIFLVPLTQSVTQNICVRSQGPGNMASPQLAALRSAHLSDVVFLMSTSQAARCAASPPRAGCEVKSVVSFFLSCERMCVVGKSANYSGNWEPLIRTSKQICTSAHSEWSAWGKGGGMRWVKGWG